MKRQTFQRHVGRGGGGGGGGGVRDRKAAADLRYVLHTIVRAHARTLLSSAHAVARLIKSVAG